MREVRDGDISKLGSLFERHHVSLFDFLSRTMGDRAAAEDLVQEVFIRILKYRATYRDEGRFETWMFQIARNARIDYSRRRPFDPLEDHALELPSQEQSPVEQLEQAEDMVRLRCALMKMPLEKRELIVLARYRGMKTDQIAEVIGAEPGTVRVRLHRALKELGELVRHAQGDSRCNVKRFGTGSRTF
jgi:RNA polymerase sigma-70 factor (ECF subfamily)